MAGGDIVPVDPHPFSAAQSHALHVLTGIGAALSILAVLFIMLSYVIFPNLRKPTYKLVVWMSLCDLCVAFSYFVGYGGSDEACQAQGALMQLFGVASMLWSAVFAYHLIVVLVRHARNEHEYERWYHLCVWLPALVFLVVALTQHGFESGELWCWLRADSPAMRIGLYYAPFVVLFVFMSVCFVLVSQSLIGERSQRDVNRRLLLYLLCFAGGRVFGFVNRLHAVVHPHSPIYALYVLHALCSPLQGFCNALVYGLNKRLRDHYRIVCSRDPHAALAQSGYVARDGGGAGGGGGDHQLILTEPAPS